MPAIRAAPIRLPDPNDPHGALNQALASSREQALQGMQNQGALATQRSKDAAALQKERLSNILSLATKAMDRGASPPILQMLGGNVLQQVSDRAGLENFRIGSEGTEAALKGGIHVPPNRLPAGEFLQRLARGTMPVQGGPTAGELQAGVPQVNITSTEIAPGGVGAVQQKTRGSSVTRPSFSDRGVATTTGHTTPRGATNTVATAGHARLQAALDSTPQFQGVKVLGPSMKNGRQGYLVLLPDGKTEKWMPFPWGDEGG